MKKSKSITLLAICMSVTLVTTSVVAEPIEVYAQADVPQSSVIKKSKSQKKPSNNKLPNGVKSLTKADKQWAKKNMINAKSVALNEIGLKRVNEARTKKGLKPISSSKAVKLGNEVNSSGSTQVGTSGANSLIKSDEVQTSNSAATSTLPDYVDNSELKYFPAISNQGDVGSCVSFSTTYYQASYMNALAHGWDLKNNSDDSKLFSPRWTYNLINNGDNVGSRQEDAYSLFKEQGIATQKDLPYMSDASNPLSYRGWSTDPKVWKDAANNKLDKAGYVYTYNNGENPYPIEGPSSPYLKTVKQMLNDGYIFSVVVPISDVATGVIKATGNPNNDKYVGQKAIIGGFGSYDHGVTVVGYDDDMWVDMNQDGTAEDAEKGAFKVINSWGNTNAGDNSGVVWISYDALNRGSALATEKGVSLPIYNNESSSDIEGSKRKLAMFQYDMLYWMTMKTSNTPRLLVQADINTAHRDKLKFKLGYSDDNGREVTWQPRVLNGRSIGLKSDTGDFSFDGTTTASDGTVVLDYSNFLPSDLSNTKRKWYFEVSDSSNSAVLKGFRFIDPSAPTQDLDPSSCNYQINDSTVGLTDYKLASPKAIGDGGNQTTISMNYGLNSNDKAEGQWSMKKPLANQYTNLHNMVTYNNKIYTMCTDESAKSLNRTKVLQYDPTLDSWKELNSNSLNNLNYYIFILNSKIYATTSTGTTYIYDISSGTWSTDSTFSFPTGITKYGLTTLNDKLYVIGGVKDKTPVNTVWEYDPSIKVWTQKASMNASVEEPIVSVAKDDSDGGKEKIYMLGGSDMHGDVTQMEKYDPSSSDTQWSKESLNPYFDESPLCYNISYSDGNKYASPVSIGDRIYMIKEVYEPQDFDLYEYSTLTKDWIKRDTALPNANCFRLLGAQGANEKMYMIGKDSCSSNVLQYNPSISDEESGRVSVPRCNISGGTYDKIDPISIRCTTPGAEIHYTTDGTEPTKNSPIYTGTIAVNGKTTIKAIAIKSGLVDSYVMTTVYDIGANVPRFSIPSGNYTQYKQQVSISCTTSGAEIHYTTDGTDPTKNSPVYTGPITLYGHKTILKAVAIKAGMDNSDVASATYKAPLLVGDVSGDSKINVMDYIQLKNYVNGKTDKFPNINLEDYMWAGDVNGDGKIDATDALLLKLRLGNHITYFSKELSIKPTSLTAASTTSINIALSWSNPIDTAGIDHYEIYRDGSLLNDKVATNSFTDNKVTAGTQYNYIVLAVDSQGRKFDATSALKVSASVQ